MHEKIIFLGTLSRFYFHSITISYSAFQNTAENVIKKSCLGHHQEQDPEHTKACVMCVTRATAASVVKALA